MSKWNWSRPTTCCFWSTISVRCIFWTYWWIAYRPICLTIFHGILKFQHHSWRFWVIVVNRNISLAHRAHPHSKPVSPVSHRERWRPWMLRSIVFPAHRPRASLFESISQADRQSGHSSSASCPITWLAATRSYLAWLSLGFIGLYLWEVTLKSVLAIFPCEQPLLSSN